MTYTTLTKDYPRYPSVFDCGLTEPDRDMLMVCIILLSKSDHFHIISLI